MHKRGQTAAGTQRWRCSVCQTSTVKTRADTKKRHLRKWFVRWITGVRELAAIARLHGHSRRQMVRLFEPFWSEEPFKPPQSIDCEHLLIVDGVYLSGRTNAVLIGHSGTEVCSWDFAERECVEAWCNFLSRFQTVEVIVMDGQKGLAEAISRHCPEARIQRCLAHIERFVRSHISTRPKTLAGLELWRLTRSVWQIQTLSEARQWTEAFYDWNNRHDPFLKERSYSAETGRWWYTHRKLRAARSHITNALPYMFTFIAISGVPRTTNCVEGGINSRLKELIRRHRGLSSCRKRILAAYFLRSRMGEKPPRNVT